MSTIYPEHLLESILNDPMRGAERRMYEALAKMSDAFVVFYSVAWQGKSRDGNVQDGEADFVVAHPELGILVIEVKGGGIRYDGAVDQWHSGGHKIKDPALQAQSSRYELMRRLQDIPGWGEDWLTTGHAVAFPDVVIGKTDLKLNIPNEIILDGEDFGDLEAAIRRIFSYYAGAGGKAGALRHPRLELLKKLLVRSFNICTPLGVEMAHEDERLVELTERQMLILDFLSTRRRAAIQGCAGSGKTMLALEKAHRLAELGFEVLLTCYNVNLAHFLRKRAPEGVDVMHFHELCREIIKEGGFAIKPVRDERELNEIVLPEMMLEAIDETGPLYDAIIVDEGQDFKENWWLPLVSLLRDQDHGILFVFYDDNQNIYRGGQYVAQAVEEAPFPLVDNCRNTQKIHALVSEFHQDGGRLRCPGPAGRPPEVIPYVDAAGMERELKKVLHRLVVDEHISAQDIALLTPRGPERSELKAGTKLGVFTLTKSAEPEGLQIQVSSIHSFKGLERRVIILAELDNAIAFTPEEILYIGCSRARTHLILLHDAAWAAPLRSKLQRHAT